jgi:hypothetical protein
MTRNLFYPLLCILFISSCSTQKNGRGKPVTALKFIGEYSLPHKLQFEGTTVGGLSSIDYSPAEDIYYLVCDDRSDINPARFYTAKIFISPHGIDSVRMIKTIPLLQKNGEVYPNKKQQPANVPDPEALRLNHKKGTIVWSSEGERIVRNGAIILTDPSINSMRSNGQLIDTFFLPGNMRMKAIKGGPRQNGVFEGLAFADNFKTLYVSVEEPLYEDGHRAGLYDSTGWIRIIKYDVDSKMPLAQYAYQIDAVVQEPISSGLFIVNGVADILAISDKQLLVTERSFSAGRLGNNVRVYLVDLDSAENVAGIGSLQKNPPQRPLQKKLLVNMDKLGRLIDNVEGATLGPRLPNGKRSLLFVADDNFSSLQKTQFLLFEVQD